MTRDRFLLWCGVVAGPLFIAVFLVNDQIRNDYDPVRDFVSEAAIGPGGWLQIANFLVTGALVVAFAVAARRAVSPWTGLMLAVFGAGLMLAGIFVSDPSPHTSRTGHGIVHDLVSVVVFFLSLPVAAFVAARWRPSTGWKWYCRAVGAAVPVLFVLAGAMESTTGVFQRLSIAVGWIWVSALAVRALRLTAPASAASPGPSPASPGPAAAAPGPSAAAPRPSTASPGSSAASSAPSPAEPRPS
jgi:hypothetical membrane protein